MWLLLGIGVIVVWNLQVVALVLIFCGFAASGFVKWFYYKVIRKRSPIAPVASILRSKTAGAAKWEPEK